MAVTGTKTNQDLITEALRLARVAAKDETPDADDTAYALDTLHRMLKGWQNKGHNLWTIASQTLSLTTAASYTLSPARPLRILNANLRRGGLDTPMQELTRGEYDTLPNKSSTGLPTTFYYDRQREAALFYIWPVLAAANGETVEITFEREIEDAALGDVADIPGEWWDAVVYNLADRLADLYDTNNQMVTARAAMLLDEALSADREGSVFFGEPW